MGEDKHQVLIVDDEPGVRYLLKEILLDEGLIIHTAGSAIEVLVSFDIMEIDLIILDIKMPGMDGLELYKILIGKGFHGKVILMTANGGDDRMMERARTLGVKKFLIKPFDVEELIEKVFTALNVTI